MTKQERIPTSRTQVLRWIAGYIAAHGYPPSLRDITTGLGYEAPSTALHHVRQMDRMGAITRAPGVARSIQLTARGAAQIEVQHG